MLHLVLESRAKHAKQWQTTLATYVEPVIGTLAVADIDVTHILRVLEQPVPAGRGFAAVFWAVRRETASRVRGRIALCHINLWKENSRQPNQLWTKRTFASNDWQVRRISVVGGDNYMTY